MSNSSMRELLNGVKGDVVEQASEDRKEEEIKQEQKEQERAKVQNESSKVNKNEQVRNRKSENVDKPTIKDIKISGEKKEVIEEIKELYKKYYEVDKINIEKDIKNYNKDDIEALLRYRDDMLRHAFPLSNVHQLVMKDIENEK